MTPVITIPVTPLIMSLFNDCKDNLKYSEKSDADFLIFLLNSSMHIYSIVKEFAPLLPIGNDPPPGKTPLPKKKSGENTRSTPKKGMKGAGPGLPVDRTDQIFADVATSDEEEEEEEGEKSVANGEDADVNEKIAQHYSKNKLAAADTASGKEFKCSRCSAWFASTGTLKRHEMICTTAPSTPALTTTAEDAGSSSSDDSCAETPVEYSDFLPLKCADCKKRFATVSNLNRHLKLSRRCGKTTCGSDQGGDQGADTKKLLSTSLPTYLPTTTTTTTTTAETPPAPSPTTCTYCGSEFASEKTYNVHIRKFRCKRRCKICDFTSGQSVFIQNHMIKEHGISDSIDDIEEYNKALFLEHFNLKSVGGTMADADLPPEYHCTVYDCVFSTLHKGGLNTHIRYHTAQIAASSGSYRNCDICRKTGIPSAIYDRHSCTPRLDDPPPSSTTVNNENSSAVENVGSEKSSAGSAESGIKISPTKHPLVLSLKRKIISSSVVKLNRPAGAAEVSSIPPTKKDQLQSIRIDLGNGKVRYQCRHCDFLAETNQSIAGHMNTHKPKKQKVAVE